jgi:hypothetical protein
MRLRLGIALALIAIGGSVRPTPPGTSPQPDKPTRFDPPEVILDGSEYRRLYPTFSWFRNARPSSPAGSAKVAQKGPGSQCHMVVAHVA